MAFNLSSLASLGAFAAAPTLPTTPVQAQLPSLALPDLGALMGGLPGLGSGLGSGLGDLTSGLQGLAAGLPDLTSGLGGLGGLGGLSDLIGQAQLGAEQALMYGLTQAGAFLAADHFYVAPFTALNGSGVTGGAILALDDATHTLTVAIHAAGVEAGLPHLQHIHGFVSGQDSVTPTPALDADHDGYVELGEGVPAYGPVLLNLVTNHDNGAGGDNGHSHDGALTGVPTAPDGSVWFLESYTLPSGGLGEDPMLALREIVIHGLSVAAGAVQGTGGDVDGTAGYKLVLPIASGEIQPLASAGDLSQFLHDTGFDQAALQQLQQSLTSDYLFT